MSPLHRLGAAVATLLASTVVAVALASSASAAPVARSASSAPTAATVSATSTASTASVPCSSVRQIGGKLVVSDLGMSAFTVRQYIGWCRDAAGSAWMNFASVYVWDQYHARGFAYRSSAGIAVRGEPETRGFTTSANRQQLSYSAPVRTTTSCTQGWGKLVRAGSESAQGLSSLVC
ncbi:hypothetical protein [Terrabacter sp. C0L_2]|uniref:hypothetical protein n=1 Tax=Terrabacter sp. C0L_2 TaxID=3108389 RepID=UPI002ED4A472|nr:hypothetical protein U5C87_11710 [Terrabacter sp. C0L_2]